MEKILLLIIGIILGAIIKHVFDRKSKLFEQHQEYKRTRYLCVIILMDALSDLEHSFVKLKSVRPDIKSKDELILEIEHEFNLMLVYSSSEMLLATQEFLNEPTRMNFRNVSIAMRKDLWGLTRGKKLSAIFNKMQKEVVCQ